MSFVKQRLIKQLLDLRVRNKKYLTLFQQFKIKHIQRKFLYLQVQKTSNWELSSQFLPQKKKMFQLLQIMLKVVKLLYKVQLKKFIKKNLNNVKKKKIKIFFFYQNKFMFSHHQLELEFLLHHSQGKLLLKRGLILKM